MIIKRELNVSNRKKADIVADLRQKGFRPFPKVSKAKAAGENAEVEDAEEEDSGFATTAIVLTSHTRSTRAICK